MRVLVTNDDGIYAPGLWSVARALSDVADVSVVAPDRDQSGVGTAMTLRTALQAQSISSPIDGIEAFSVQGTPADCVILATGPLFSEPFDLLVSGINSGSNLGLDFLVSGTVGGALHGYLRNIPSIATSVASLTDAHHEAASRITTELARALDGSPLPETPLLNVNLPNVEAAAIEAVEITRPGPTAFLENVERVQEGHRTYYWIRHNRPVADHPAKGTDIWAVENGRASITPLDLAFTRGAPSRALQDLVSQVRAALGLVRSCTDNATYPTHPP